MKNLHKREEKFSKLMEEIRARKYAITSAIKESIELYCDNTDEVSFNVTTDWDEGILDVKLSGNIRINDRSVHGDFTLRLMQDNILTLTDFLPHAQQPFRLPIDVISDIANAVRGSIKHADDNFTKKEKE